MNCEGPRLKPRPFLFGLCLESDVAVKKTKYFVVTINLTSEVAVAAWRAGLGDTYPAINCMKRPLAL